MKEPTLLDFKLISKNVEHFENETELAPHQTFQILTLIHYLGIDQVQAENALVDGSFDCGIDTVYIDEDDAEPTIYIGQSKYITKQKNMLSNFPGSAIDKLLHTIDNYILKPLPEEFPPYMNEALIQKIKDVRVIFENQLPKIQLVFMSNGIKANNEATEKLNHWIEVNNRTGNIFSYKFIDSATLVEYLAPKQSKTIDGKIKLSGEYADWSGRAGVRTIIGRISALELARIRESGGEEIFEKNIRSYLGQTKQRKINQNILDSASGKNSYNFFLLNNGITVVCDKVKYSPVKESPVLNLNNIQIVNGGQTTNSIFEAHEQGKDIENTFVLIKIIETDNEDLLNKITEATNSQTPVTSRDLKSNEKIQKNIEQQMLLKGYYYESRLDKYKKTAPRNKRVDAPVAAQAYFSFILQRPAEAKNQKRLLYTDFYDEIFDPSNYDLADQLLDSYLIFKQVHSLQKEYKEKHPYYAHAELTILALVKNLGIQNADDTDKLASAIKKTLKVLDRFVASEAKRLKDKFSYREVFISKNTLSKLIDELN